MTRVSIIDRVQAKLESIFDAPCACAAAVEEMVDEGLIGLTFEDLRNANAARSKVFKNRKGEESNSTGFTPAQWLQCVVGEVGEYANFRKKFEHGDISAEEFKVEATKELADILIYLDLLANNLGIDLGAAVRVKFNAVSKRIGVDIFL